MFFQEEEDADESSSLIFASLLNDEEQRESDHLTDIGDNESLFSRGFTFDGGGRAEDAEEAKVKKQFDIALRMSTEEAFVDPDSQFTQAALLDFDFIAEKGNEGDIPFPAGFGRRVKFWKLVLVSGMLALFMGFMCSVFLNIVDEVPKQWASCDYAKDASCGDFYSGEKWWMLVTGGTGLAVGVIRWMFQYPDNLPGIFKEIQTHHVEPRWAPLTFCLSTLSIAGGASLGPEQAMGNLGGGLAYFLSERIDFDGDQDYKDLLVLCGMTAPLGALFPSPMLGALMIHELGNPPGNYMESTILLSISACLGFIVFYEMVGVTYLDHVSSNGFYLSVDWLDSGFHNWQVGIGIAIGIISAALCLGAMLVIGILKQVFYRLRYRLQDRPFLREVLPPLIGGISIGAVNWALPATVGNGGLVGNYIIKAAFTGNVSQKLLLCTGFARVFLLGVSMNCGFVGGIIFPFITIGLIAGAIMYMNYPTVPVALCMGSFMISIACGVVPMPFTFTALVCFVFFFGLQQTVPIFVSSLISYLLLCGTGLMKKIVMRSQQS